MVHINVDGKRYSFDNYDDLEVSKSILEDILNTPSKPLPLQRLKIIKVVKSMEKALEAGLESHI